MRGLPSGFDSLRLRCKLNLWSLSDSSSGVSGIFLGLPSIFIFFGRPRFFTLVFVSLSDEKLLIFFDGWHCVSWQWTSYWVTLVVFLFLFFPRDLQRWDECVVFRAALTVSACVVNSTCEVSLILPLAWADLSRPAGHFYLLWSTTFLHLGLYNYLGRKVVHLFRWPGIVCRRFLGSELLIEWPSWSAASTFGWMGATVGQRALSYFFILNLHHVAASRSQLQAYQCHTRLFGAENLKTKRWEGEKVWDEDPKLLNFF